MLKFQADSNWKSDAPAIKVRTGKHELFVDEPAAAGGSDKGPNPLQYVLSSLAGCVTIVGRNVAKKMGIKLEEVSIRIEGDIDDRGFTGQDPTVQKGFQEMRLVVKAKADCGPDKLKEWLKVTEDMCPVGNTYRDGTRVKVELAK
jgi:uncharacterized OsmC-like protein